jgi:hypothetical protein
LGKKPGEILENILERGDLGSAKQMIYPSYPHGPDTCAWGYGINEGMCISREMPWGKGRQQWCKGKIMDIKLTFEVVGR